MRELFSKHLDPIRLHLGHVVGVAAVAAIVAFAGFPRPSLALLGAGMTTIVLWEWSRASSAAKDRDTSTLRTADALLGRGETERAARLAADLSHAATSARLRNRALTVLAWAEVANGRPTRAMEALDRIQPPHEIDLYCLAVVEDAVGKPKMALGALELVGSLSCEAAKFLVDLHARQGSIDRAVKAAVTHRKVLGAANLRKLLDASFEAWALGPAVTLAGVLFNTTGEPEDAAALVRALAYQRDFETLRHTVDEVVRRLRARGRTAETRALLAALALDTRLPSGVCHELHGRLGALDLRS